VRTTYEKDDKENDNKDEDVKKKDNRTRITM